MATLPDNTDWLVQTIDTDTVVIHRYTEEVIVRFPTADANATARAQKVIHDTDRLSAEDKCFAHFWCGYFHAYA